MLIALIEQNITFNSSGYERNGFILFLKQLFTITTLVPFDHISIAFVI